MNAIDRALTDWLNAHWDYQVHGEPRHGTFGQVWVTGAPRDRMFPKRVARKTINPQKLAAANGDDLVSIFEREMHLWLHLPYHPNVLEAHCIDVAELPDFVDSRLRRLPLVRMPFCECNLKDWIALPVATVSTINRLIALWQLSNGLLWLYQHGIEGHGDLKPDNVLVADLLTQATLHGTPAPAWRWQIRVADLGGRNRRPAYRFRLKPKDLRRAVCRTVKRA